MKALILNSGLGSRMGEYVENNPKCMVKISNEETIISRQIRMLYELGITDVVITTGRFADKIEAYCKSLKLPLNITFVYNPDYESTNYIYSIFLAREYLQDDILLMHGDLVFEKVILKDMLISDESRVVVSSTASVPQKDFKAVIDNGVVKKIGVDFFDNAISCQPLYLFKKDEFKIWLDKIEDFCKCGNKRCYAENAFNEVSDFINLKPLDIKDSLCHEIDNVNDLELIKEKLYWLKDKVVYMCFSTDIIHGGHIAIIKKAQSLGRLVVGLLSDEAVAGYKRFPLIPFSERKEMMENITGVYRVIEQNKLSYKDNLMLLKPDIVVHGDDWKEGVQKQIRNEVIETLASYGGELVEFSYAKDKKYIELDRRMNKESAMPEMRRGRLKKLIQAKGLVTAMETHSGLTGLIVENTVVEQDGGVKQFDAMWISSLCDSTAKGKPDIELVDATSRYRTIDDVCEVTTKPIIFDGDTGGLTEHFVYTVRSLERMGVSMVIIEDKKGLKKNSLFGNDVDQTQASIEEFCYKIREGKKAQRTEDFMICARIESLILEKGIYDALNRANAYCEAGADAIMIHSRKKEPDEIFEFVERFREKNSKIPIVVVPTSYNSVTEEEFKNRGVNIVIYANQFTRAAFPAMKNVAETILKNHRSKECDEKCMAINDIIRLIPEEL